MHGLGYMRGQVFSGGLAAGDQALQPAGQFHQRAAAVLEQAAAARDPGRVLARDALRREKGKDRLGQFVIRHGLEMLGIDPTQLGFVELRGTAAQVIEVEPFDELRALYVDDERLQVPATVFNAVLNRLETL